MTRNIRPPTNRGGPRVRERWEEEVSKKLDNTDYTLDDAFRALFLTTASTQGQENERAINNLAKFAADNNALRGKISQLEKRINDLEKQIAMEKTSKVEEIIRRINDLEVIAWQ